jgi:hypothetical protein
MWLFPFQCVHHYGSKNLLLLHHIHICSTPYLPNKWSQRIYVISNVSVCKLIQFVPGYVWEICTSKENSVGKYKTFTVSRIEIYKSASWYLPDPQS